MRPILLAGAAAACLMFAPFSYAQDEPSAAPDLTQEQTTPAEPANTAPATPAVAPSPAPEASCEARNVTVYFDTNSDALDSQSREAVNTAANGLGRCEIQRVLLKGYADQRGDESYNMELSERRSEAVREVLVAQGVEAEEIQIEPQGEADSTGDMSRDRRVEVEIELAALAQPAAGGGGSN